MTASIRSTKCAKACPELASAEAAPAAPGPLFMRKVRHGTREISAADRGIVD
jgi:hypothetical protein